MPPPALWIVFVFGIGFLLGYFVFIPLKRVASRPAGDVGRFQLIDLLALFVPFQIGLGGLQWLYPDRQWEWRELMGLGLASLLVGVVPWFYGMRFLWRMSIQNSLKRLLFLGLYLPCGCFFPFATGALLLGAENPGSFALRILIVVVIGCGLRYLVTWVQS